MCARPAIAVVIDTYQQGRFIERAVSSVLGQTEPADEIVVVDDGSTDDTAQRLRRFEGRVTIVHKTNGGQASAFNCGFVRCRSEVVLFLDGDDALLPDSLASIRAGWRPGLAQVHFPLTLVDEGQTELGLYPGSERLDAGDVWTSIATSGRYATVPSSGHAFARAALEPLFPLEERSWVHNADGPLYSLAPLFGPTRVINRPLGHYGIHEHNAWWPHVLGVGAEHERKRLAKDIALLGAIVDHLGSAAASAVPFRREIAQRLERLRLGMAVDLADRGNRASLARLVRGQLRRLATRAAHERRDHLLLLARSLGPRPALGAHLTSLDVRDHSGWLSTATRPRWPPRLAAGDRIECAMDQSGSDALWRGWARPGTIGARSLASTVRLCVAIEDEVERVELDLDPSLPVGHHSLGVQLRVGGRPAAELELTSRSTVTIRLERGDRRDDGSLDLEIDIPAALGTVPDAGAIRPGVVLLGLGAPTSPSRAPDERVIGSSQAEKVA